VLIFCFFFCPFSFALGRTQISLRRLPAAAGRRALDQNMKIKKPNAELVCKQIEDMLVPRLRFSSTDRAVYAHLLRHTRLEGKLRLRFSMAWLARGTRLCDGAARPAVRRLVARGALRLIECSKAGHVVEVFLPEEIHSRELDPRRTRDQLSLPRPVYTHEVDFMKNKSLRQAIHARERGRCFYCLRRITPAGRCIDHVVPRILLGSNSYRNLVSCCLQCNSQKCDRPAGDFLRWLYRERRLTDAELDARLRALDALASGKLPAPLATTANPCPRKSRPPLLPTNV
jgi:5-methylcytosine-specific restriction endonuclease McrA